MRSTVRKQYNKGFTLIELVIVIVMLGVLAVVATAKFIDLATEARVNVLKSIKGSLTEAAKLIQAKAATQGQYDNLGIGIKGTKLSFNGLTFTIYNQGVPREVWNKGFDQLIHGDFNYLGGQNTDLNTQCSDKGFCIIDNLHVPKVIRGQDGHGIFFFPNGKKLSDKDCFAYYAFQLGSDAKLVYKKTGIVTSGC